jgi:uncharacterized coiled-coil protein SlyX
LIKKKGSFTGFLFLTAQKMNENDLIELERAFSYQEKMLKELNAVVIEQGREIDRLKLLVEKLLENANVDFVKPLSEETPPPHY